MKNLIFGNWPFGKNASIEIISNDGIFNDIEKALTHYHSIFGVTDALENLQKVYFHNGGYEFLFDKDAHGVFQLVAFVLALDVEFFYSGYCVIKIDDSIFTCSPMEQMFKEGKKYDKLHHVN